ncbi:16S rRNA (uracil(1498)-N(3))-methyltransferase [Microbulbifer thermotolerans]|uniref:Ribosomal RNA small subunit methyltransferase E n=1 Tax=Microbulbifer thermotolerans TaxID=252514 RepID=A0AB35HZZ2_MICTH|nr:16S rRNA (uracil(1498)-N(3))-methyltransferase [Microbulbifer thermotolerans]MCX2802799.1 16S rRNA (uracil(1498)-N(3))-methyltransferase [Microbulbifer thermotolerans]MCX2841754.1 16S rRNA (uracil(1498)-N(3))-methyltransferase [Microbulbifer thermotolerans]WKT59506.1 16S rRNA (uracil(1498)-N(3))-methyltransferase [Microbulbifer thermotolerans]
MNLIILEQSDFVAPDRVRLRGRRQQHIREVHRATPGDRLRVGLLNGDIGHGEITAQNGDFIELKVDLHRPPPDALPLTLILALPRPKMLKRVIEHATALGVKNLYLINAYRVEKSYWQTPWLHENKLRELCLLGLEQAVDTRMPQVHLRKRFKPFVEDELPGIAADSLKLVAHPVAERPCPVDIAEPATLVVGPEGGFIPYEVDKLRENGFEAVHLGPRILRVETALPVLLGRIFPGR